MVGERYPKTAESSHSLAWLLVVQPELLLVQYLGLRHFQLLDSQNLVGRIAAYSQSQKPPHYERSDIINEALILRHDMKSHKTYVKRAPSNSAALLELSVPWLTFVP